MRCIFVFIIALFWVAPLTLLAQDVPSTPADSLAEASDTTYWTNSLLAGINFNQASFSGNWKGGGVNSVALGSYLIAKSDYIKDRISWNNQLDFQYGFLKNQGQDFRKSTDKLFLDSKVAYALGEKRTWNIFASTTFLTQFAEGFEYLEDANGVEIANPISNFLAPAYWTTALGMEWKPDKHFSLRLGLLSPKITIVNDTALHNNLPSNYGVEIGKTSRLEWAASSIVAGYNKNLSENINLTTLYQGFVNYENFALDRIDHRLDLTLTAKVAKLVNVNLQLIVIDDKDQDKEIQISQALAIGLIYQLNNVKPKK